MSRKLLKTVLIKLVFKRPVISKGICHVPDLEFNPAVVNQCLLNLAFLQLIAKRHPILFSFDRCHDVLKQTLIESLALYVQVATSRNYREESSDELGAEGQAGHLMLDKRDINKFRPYRNIKPKHDEIF